MTSQGNTTSAGYGARTPTASVTQSPASAREALSWTDLLRLARARPFLVFGIAAVVAALLLTFFGLRSPTYRASATLLVEGDAPSGGVLGQLASLTAPPIAAGEMEVLRSRTVAEATARQAAGSSISSWSPDARNLGLATTVEDRALRPLSGRIARLVGTPTGSARVHAWIAPDAVEGELWIDVSGENVEVSTPGWFGGSLGRTPLGTYAVPRGVEHQIADLGLTLRIDGKPEGRSFVILRVDYETAVKRLRKATQVIEVERNTGVLRVSVDDPDPARAAAAVNAICNNYLDANVARGKRLASRTLEFLDAQVEVQLQLLQAAERELVESQTARPDLINVAETTRILIENAATLSLDQMRIDLSRATLSSVVEGVRTGSLDALSQISDPNLFDPLLLARIQQHQVLLQDKAVLVVALTDLHPQVEDAQRLVDASRIEVQNLLSSKLQGLAARRVELEKETERLEQQLALIPEGERVLADPLRRYETHTAVYTFLLTSQQEAQLTQASTIASTDVIDPAIPPSERHAPRLSGVALIGLFLGLCLGLLTARIVDLRLGPIENEAEFESATGLSILASIPDFHSGPTRVRDAGPEFLALRDAPEHAAAEAYRGLRANLRRLPDGASIVHVAATSAAPGEGKSTTNIDLALASAATGRKVLLVDADMRKPSVHRYLKLDRSPGLADVLEGRAEWRDAIVESELGLKVLPAGKTKRSPGDLFASERAGQLLLEFGKEFDVVVYDLPPALAVADAADFAHRLDAMFLVHKMGAVPRSALVEAKRRLNQVGAPLVGGVLNAVKTSRGEMKRYGYGYYGEDEDA